MPNRHLERSRRISSYPRSQVRVLGARRRRAVRRLERIFFLRCGPVGHFALWKPPRYFSVSKFAGLATARRNQIGESVWIFSVVEAPCEFVHVQREILLANFVIVAENPALKERPESLNCVCVSSADYVFALTVAHDAMRQRIA